MNSGVFYGDAEHVLKTLPSGLVQCCVTSPPYWGLRDYSVAGQFGLEKTIDEYIERMVGVFREVWRVLRDDGTAWLNLGDSYARDPKKGVKFEAGERTYMQNRQATEGNRGPQVPVGLKPKDLCMIPARVALALQADGWWLRSDIIWSKPNPMPESCTDRPTSAHEHLFLLSKSGTSKFWAHRDGAGARQQPEPDYHWRHKETGEEVGTDPDDKDNWQRFNLWRGHDYFYDADAIREEAICEGDNRHLRADSSKETGGPREDGGSRRRTGNETHGRNKRTVWEIPTAPYAGAHFATFPPALVEPCILAGTSPRACEICGAPWKRLTEKSRSFESGSGRSGRDPIGKNGPGLQGGGETRDIRRGPCLQVETTGWQPTCSCDNEGKGRCLVLDPFAGSGTTGEVALKHGRDYLLIELNRDYEKLIRGRLGLFYEEAEAAMVN